MRWELDAKHRSEQDRKDAQTQTQYVDRVAESAYQAVNPDNPKRCF
jgi:hypothetical protein